MNANASPSKDNPFTTGVRHLNESEEVAQPGHLSAEGCQVVASVKHVNIGAVMLVEWDEGIAAYRSYTMFAYLRNGRWRETDRLSGGTAPNLDRFNRQQISRGGVFEDGRHTDWVPVNGETLEMHCSEFWCNEQVVAFSTSTSIGELTGKTSSWGAGLVVYPAGESVTVRFYDAQHRVLESLKLEG
ncbi:hypothetical protein ACIP8U_38760 [Streptomyces pseudovenezuelae]|uniref:hypothetical protein n=1 Tax=Streptomyces pseudovenezuelae TaxID=67350 RepID=UPI0037F6595B